MTFDPTRFLASENKKPEMDPRQLTFGFGRRCVPSFSSLTPRQLLLARICPGLHLADATVFISCAMTLAAFDVTKTIENGVVIEPVHESTTGTIRYASPLSTRRRLTRHQPPETIQVYHQAALRTSHRAHLGRGTLVTKKKKDHANVHISIFPYFLLLWFLDTYFQFVNPRAKERSLVSWHYTPPESKIKLAMTISDIVQVRKRSL
jgi:hypothetical protein